MTARYLMGTFLTIDAQASCKESRETIRDALFDEVRRLERLLSFYLPGSDISRLNAAAGLRPVGVHPDTLALLKLSLDYAKKTDGSFDPAFRSQGAGDWRDVALDERAGRAFLAKSGMKLDLGAIGKGFALDRALKLAEQAPEAKRVFLDFGGQLSFWGRDGKFPPQTVAIEDPDRRDRFLSTFIVEHNSSVSTSSNAERPGHLSSRGCRSVTVRAADGAQAEALSTALFVLEPGNGKELLTRFPEVSAWIH